jgi:hypothetical protein
LQAQGARSLSQANSPRPAQDPDQGWVVQAAVAAAADWSLQDLYSIDPAQDGAA